MKIDRRNALKGAALLGATAAIPATAARAAAEGPLLVYDSRLAETRAFLDARLGHRSLDISAEDNTLWQSVRNLGDSHRQVEGLTRWSDFVQLREAFEERGLRVTAERRVAAPLSNSRELFRWSMRDRNA